MAPPRAGCDSDSASVAGMSSSPSTADGNRKRNLYVRHCIAFRSGKCTKTDCRFPHLSKAQLAQERNKLKEANTADAIAAVATSKAKAKPKAKAKAPACPCILSCGNQLEAQIGICGNSRRHAKVTFNDRIDVDEIPVDGNNQMKIIRQRVQHTRVGRLNNPSCLPLALCCAINRARRLANRLFGHLYRNVICWMEDQIMRFDSKLAMIDTEDEHWRTSWGLISCWKSGLPDRTRHGIKIGWPSSCGLQAGHPFRS